MTTAEQAAARADGDEVPPRRPITEVAAGVVLRGDPSSPEFLLAQRPVGKVYAGYWEFPGGKVEPGETAHEALVRELHEELGVHVEHAWPWLCREFVYPHARVRLKFFRIRSWHGEIAAIEHSGFSWTKVDDATSVAPILPANIPILRALALPSVYALSNAEENGVEAELARLEGSFASGLRFVQMRDKTLPRSQRLYFVHAVMSLARSYPQVRVLINDDLDIARCVGAAGVHLSSKRLWESDRRPDVAYAAASCHNADDLARAAQLDLDFAVLGPVLPTASHPGTPGIGWLEFTRLAETSPIPVYALGGLRADMLETASRHGAHGIALMRGW